MTIHSDPIDTQAARAVHEAATPMARETGWKCFHCGEYFMTQGAARDHFGFDPSHDPGCRIKLGAERGLLMALRKSESEIETLTNLLHDENSEGYRVAARQSSRHQSQLMEAEEAGYESGLRDGRTEAAGELDTLRARVAALQGENGRLRQAIADIANQINIVGSPYDLLIKAAETHILDIKRRARAALAAGATTDD